MSKNETKNLPRRSEMRSPSPSPTIEEFVDAGNEPQDYPPRGHLEVESDGLRVFKATGALPSTAKYRHLDRHGTHLIGRSRTPSFRRAGVQFTQTYAGFALDDLAPDQVERILRDPNIDARIGTLDDLEALGADTKVLGDSSDPTSKAELRQQLADAHARADASDRALSDLRASLAGDKPPSKGGAPIGSDTNPLPTPK